MNDQPSNKSTSLEIAEKVKAHCAKVAKEELLDASIQGLCLEGAIEVALGAINSIDTQKIISEIEANS